MKKQKKIVLEEFFKHTIEKTMSHQDVYPTLKVLSVADIWKPTGVDWERYKYGGIDFALDRNDLERVKSKNESMIMRAIIKDMHDGKLGNTVMLHLRPAGGKFYSRIAIPGKRPRCRWGINTKHKCRCKATMTLTGYTPDFCWKHYRRIVNGR